jgi:hypothetical protein
MNSFVFIVVIVGVSVLLNRKKVITNKYCIKVMIVFLINHNVDYDQYYTRDGNKKLKRFCHGFVICYISSKQIPNKENASFKKRRNT